MRNLQQKFNEQTITKKKLVKVKGGASRQFYGWENAVSHGGCPPPEHT